MFDAGTDENELIALGAKIGADVPFCIRRGTVLARGIGEKMTDTLQNPTLHLLIAKPYGENISTPLAFAEIDARGLCKRAVISMPLSHLWSAGISKLRQSSV